MARGQHRFKVQSIEIININKNKYDEKKKLGELSLSLHITNATMASIIDTQYKHALRFQEHYIV